MAWALTVAACGSDGTDSAGPEPSTAPIELRGADGNSEAIEAFAEVSAAYEAFNTGDVITFATSAWGVDPALLPADDNEVGYLEAARAAGAGYDVPGCDYVGIIESEEEGRNRGSSGR